MNWPLLEIHPPHVPVFWLDDDHVLTRKLNGVTTKGYIDEQGQFTPIIIVEKPAMTKTEKYLAAIFLRLASDEFSNRGANDFHLAHYMPNKAERREFMKGYHEWNGDPEEYDATRSYEYVPDFALMSYLASKL